MVSLTAIGSVLSGSAVMLVYGAIWRHAPAKFPRSLDEWWDWFRGANQEIAAQRSGAPIPTTPAEPAETRKDQKS